MPTKCTISPRIARTALSCWALSCLLLSVPSLGQEATAVPTIDPRIFGFDLPAGPIRPGAGRVVEVRDNAGKLVVAKVHVELSDQWIVMLPDGQLEPRSKEEVHDTERPFVAITKEDLATRLKDELELDGFATKKTRR